MQNPDGSTDLFLGAESSGGQGEELARDGAGRGYFAILRLYGPTEPALAKTWKPGDFEKMT